MTRYLITGGSVLDATGSKPKKKTALFIEDGRIAKIGREEAVKAHAAKVCGNACRTIDATGKTVMPGMIDVHVHTSYGDVTSAEELNLYASGEYRALRGALNIRKVLRAGVTSLVDPGGTWRVATALRDAVNAGMIEGPRMKVASQYLTTYNGIGSVFPTWVEHPVSAFSVMCNTRDELVKEVRRQVRDSVDVIKVSGDGDVLRSEGGMGGSLTLDDLKAVSEITHLLGKRCTIHARGRRAARDAVEAGFDWIIHASYIEEEDVDAFLETGTPINPTLVLLANVVEWGPDLGCPAPILEGLKRELDAAHRNLSRAHRAGVTMMAGSDSGQSSVPYGEWHARELEIMQDVLGMSAMEAIQTGTRNAAFALGMEDRIGTLEEGKYADVLVVDGDPLADITVLQDKERLDVVMKDGEIVDTRTPLPQPRIHRWEKPQRIWSDPRTATQEFVRTEATSKPEWMVRKAKAGKAKTKRGAGKGFARAAE